MLIEFTVGNYRSFKEAVTLSLVAGVLVSRNKSLDTENIISVDPKLSLLTSAAVYGANASGKSNLLTAMRFMRSFVLDSSRESQSDDRIPTEPFRLSTGQEGEPSLFETVFIVDRTKYRYGFEINQERIVAEWLYHVPRVRESRLFLRDEQGIVIADGFREGRGIAERTRDNALFLSVVAQFNGAIARQILLWFRQINISIGINDIDDHFGAIRRFNQLKDTNRVVKLIRDLDLGINEVYTENKTNHFHQISLFDIDDSRIPYFKRSEGFENIVVKTVHQRYDQEGKPIDTEVFDMSEHESAGTNRLFSLLLPIIEVLQHGLVLVIDELDARLHPLITCTLIGLFNNKSTNPLGAQLIFTTHDTNLLSSDTFRRDQIWFTEKDRYGATHLYSLAEFKVRNDASFEKDYISGRYGAIPFIGNISETLGDGHAQE